MSNIFVTEISGTGVFAVPANDAQLSAAQAGIASLLAGIPQLSYDSVFAWVKTADGAGPPRTLNALVANAKWSTVLCPDNTGVLDMTNAIRGALLASANIDSVSVQDVNLVDQGPGGGILSFPGIQNTYFVDKGSNTSPDGSVQEPFHNIQDGIDAASDGDLVLVYPGTYVEQIEAKTGVTVRGIDQLSCILENTGVDASTYPLDDSADQEWRIENMTVRATDPSGVIHRMGNTSTGEIRHEFIDCHFTSGAFTEIASQSNMKILFLRCRSTGDTNGFRTTGALDRNLEIRFSEHIMDCSPDFQSTHAAGSGQIICFNATRPGDATVSWTVGGDWSLAAGASWLGGLSGGIRFESDRNLNLFLCYLDGGVVFANDPNQVEVVNSVFTLVPGGQGDIDVDVGAPPQIVLNRYSGNSQYRGLAGAIAIPSKERAVGGDQPDRYMSLQDACDSIIGHDTVIRLREDVALTTPLTVNTYRQKIEADGKHTIRGAPGFANLIVAVRDNQNLEFENIEMSGTIDLNGNDATLGIGHNATLLGALNIDGGDSDTVATLDHARMEGTSVYPYAIIFRSLSPKVIVKGNTFVIGDTSGGGSEAVRYEVDSKELYVEWSTITHGSIGVGANPFMRTFAGPATAYSSHHNAYNANPQAGALFANAVAANAYDTYDPAAIY